MKRIARKIFVAVITFVAIVGLAWADDEIERYSAKIPLRGTITAETAHELTIQRKDTGKTESVPLNDVQRVKYDKVSIDLANADAYAQKGEFTRSTELYDKVVQQSVGREFAVRAASFGKVNGIVLQAFHEPARIDEAIKAIEDFRIQNPNSRYHYALHETLGKLQLTKLNEEAARAAFAELAKAPWPDLKLKASIYEGRILIATNQLDAAIAKFDGVAQSAGDSAEEKQRRFEASLGKAEILVKQKKFDDAEKLVSQVIDGASSEESALHAAAFNFRGDVQRETGRVKEALLSYLYVDLICPGDRNEHAKSLCYIALLSEQLGRADRAEDSRSRLKKDYPNSPWVKVAESGAKAE
jgi:tetratricopeptide (TPR) repeat protein